ncbi:hypothetical protein JCM5350_005498 [Sporobolomyces pararoseus]
MSKVASESTILVVPVAPCSASDATRLINSSTIEVETASTASREEVPHLFIPWNIRNKYYTANVQFCILEPDTTSQESIALVTGGGEEPAVIVLAASQETPPDSLKDLLESLSGRNPEFDVSLLVTIPPSNSSASLVDTLTNPTIKFSSSSDQTPTVNEEVWDDLALDNGFEWIDLSDSKDFRHSTMGREGETEIDHDDGIGRIRDAVESHMWEGMVRVTKAETRSARDSSNSRLQKGGFDGVENEEEDVEEDDLESMGVPPLPEPRPFIPTKLEFPSTFLPSVPRKSTTATKPPSATLPSQSSSQPEPNEADQSSFEDDFSPFVQASSSSTSASFKDPFPSLVETSSSFSTSRQIPQGTNGTDGLEDEDLEHGEEHEEDLESLDNLFEQIRLAREEVIAQEEGVKGEEMDEETVLRRRRERAEKLLEQVLGAGGF